MNTKININKNTLKLIITGIVGIALILMAGFGVVCLKQPMANVKAADTSTITITNPSFDSDSSFAPSGYTAYVGYTQDTESSRKTGPIVAGAINLEDSEYINKFTNATRDTATYGKNVLMIDSQKNIVNFGYQTSKAIEMVANSNYIITVDVYTETNAGIANLFLLDNAKEGIDKEFLSIKNINTKNNWNTYHLLVSNNDVTTLNLNLGLYLRGAGTVLFDNISAKQVSNTHLSTYLNNLETYNIPHAYNKTESVVVNSYKIDNGSFVNTDSSKSTDTTGFTYKSPSNPISYTEANSDGVNTHAFVIENTDKTYVQYSTKEDFITFEQGQTYKVSLNVKTENIDGNANIQLVRTDNEDDEANVVNSEIIKITTSTGSADNISNNYDTYSFYVYSDPTKATSYKLVFGLGDEETTTSGKLYINTLTIAKIDYTTYKNAKTGSTNKSEKLDMVSYYSFSNGNKSNYETSGGMFTNGEFDAFEIADVTNPLPANPSNWSVSTGANTQYYGVVNTSKSLFNSIDKTKFSILSNPYGDADINNNVLMMYNSEADTLSYTSTKTENLSANTYHKFEAKVQTQYTGSTLKLALITTKDEKEIELASTIVSTNNQQWKDVALYLYTGNQDIEVSLKITLNTTAYGYAYIDNVKFNNNGYPTETEFNNASTQDTTIAKANLSNLLLRENNSAFYFSDDNEEISPVIINAENPAETSIYVNNSNLYNFKEIPGTDKEAIVIRSLNDVKYTTSSNIGFKLTSNNYYKISVAVFTQNIRTNVADVDESKLGATFKITGFDNGFTAINTNDMWKTYTFYIKPSSSEKTAYLEFGIGSDDATAIGEVFFGNIVFEDITSSMTEDNFNALTDSTFEKVLKSNSTNTNPEDATKPSDTAENTPINTSLIFYYISAFVFAIAIVIAVIGVLVRKIKFKKPTKKSKLDYDRNKTVSKQVYMRKATTARETKLLELNKDFEKLNAERSKFEEEYKRDLSKLRELKIKRANPAEISKLEKEMKRNQHTSSSLGVTLNKIQAEIEYVKTDAYLNALMKKLSRESSLQNNNEEKSE